MTLNIALFLSSDGIAVAHRQPVGHWAMIGETPFDVPDLGEALSELRALAVEREGDPFEALLVLPDDQILYTSLTAPTADPELTAFRIEEGLDGLTPYAVTELEYDWRVSDEDRVKIAVVARETLDEARNFAAQHGFMAAGFAGMPPMERFPGVPTFELGARAADMGFSAEGIAFGADMFGKPDPEPVQEASPEPADLKDQALDEPVSDRTPEPVPEAETPSATEAEQASQLPMDTGTVPAASEDTVSAGGDPTPVPEIQPAEPEARPAPPVSAPPVSALAEALNAAAEAAAKGDYDIPPDLEPSLDSEDEIQPIEDPSLSAPIVPITEDPKQDADRAAGGPAAEDGDDDDMLPPAPSAAALEARQRARIIRGDATKPRATDRAETTDTGQFSATRGRIDAPGGARGALIGERNTRFGLTQAAESGAVDPGLASPGDPVPDPSPDATTPRFAEQLQRVRSAAKSRPKPTSKEAPGAKRPRVEIDPELGPSGLAAERRPSPFDDPAPKTVGAATSQARGGPLSGLLGRRHGAPTTGTASEDGGGVPDDDGSFTSGLLARKVSAPAGGSFRTGLILTVILLLLLALVAIWSAVFLPNSPVARLLGLGGSEVSDTSSFPVAPAPDAFTNAPLIGQPTPGPEPSLADEAAADGMDLGEETAGATEDSSASVPAVEEFAAAIVETPPEEVLPDIDADLDLPPLPPIDQGSNPTIAEAEVLYSEDGIWARSPERPDLRPFDLLDRVYTASIDPAVSAFDPVALPDPGVTVDETQRRFPPPPAFGTEFDLTEEGLVAPTPEGVLTPDGVFVVSGRPAVVAQPRPGEIVAELPPAIDTDDAILGVFRPAERPGDLIENRERQLLGGLTETELGERRPAERPVSPQEAAARASLFPEDEPDPTVDADVDEVTEVAALSIGGTDLAVSTSLMPRARPANIQELVASAERAPAPSTTAVAPEAVAAAPSIPSNSDVSRAATERNAIRLRNVNLIGVTGTPSERRALVRLSSGRFVRVGVGDRLDGGRVAAVGETTLQYVRNGRTVTLEIPG